MVVLVWSKTLLKTTVDCVDQIADVVKKSSITGLNKAWCYNGSKGFQYFDILSSLEIYTKTAKYEQQINSLQEQLNTAEWTIQEEREAHEDFMKASEEWGKRQKKELLDRIKELEAEVTRLVQENRRQRIDSPRTN